jgi:RHS repeat-associated protein
VKITATGPAYYHHDGLGSTIALTGENGELLESYRYDAFGAVTILSPSTLDPRPSTAFGNRFLFTGREWLSQVGLYDYRNRMYSAQIGRFLQTDPIRFAAGDVNIYRYCGNSATNRIDPSGLCDDGDGGDIINSLQTAWNNNGSYDLSVSGGNVLGGSLTLSMSKGGFSITPSIGLGYGLGGSFTASLNVGNASGMNVGATGSFGNGLVGGGFSGGNSFGGSYFSVGAGIGVGAGVSAGFGWTFNVKY